MNDPSQGIGVVRGAAAQDLFRQVVDRWRPTLRLAGVIAESHGLADRRCCAGYLRRIGTEERFSIFEDQRAGSTACHLDGGGALMAAEAVQRDIAAGCDLVLLSKFGKLEAAGNGLRGAFEAALAAHVPILTTVSLAVMEAWTGFVKSDFIILPTEIAEIDGWIETVRLHAPPPPRTSVHKTA